VNLVVILSENEFTIPFPNSLSIILCKGSVKSLILQEDMVSVTHDLTCNLLSHGPNYTVQVISVSRGQIGSIYGIHVH